MVYLLFVLLLYFNIFFILHVEDLNIWERRYLQIMQLWRLNPLKLSNRFEKVSVLTVLESSFYDFRIGRKIRNIMGKNGLKIIIDEDD
jgi:hypothetical protein